MGRLAMIVVVGLALVAVLLGYIRLAPSDTATWHVAPEITENTDLDNGVMRLADTGPDGLARLKVIAAQTPRTVVLAGSVASGMITFVTRSRIMGFPDYTTARQDGDTLSIYARSRFGGSDMGVNKARIDAWLLRLQPAG